MRSTISSSRGLPRRAAKVACCLVLFVFFGAESLAARGGFSGGGFKRAPSFRPSSARSFSMPKLSSPRSGFTWGSRQPKPRASATSPESATLPRSFGGAASTRSVYDAARSKGTLFSSRDEAATNFGRSYGSRYGSTFSSPPSTRPSWIPETTTIGGRSVNVVYSPMLGGYGYLNPLLGTWMLYDALKDAAMMDRLMAGNGYYYGPPPVYGGYDPGFVNLAVILLFVIVMIAIASGAARRRRRP